MKSALGLLVLTLLAGCATPPPATAIKLPLNARPEAFAASSGNGAIFQSGNSQPRPAMALFEDRRARYVGDTLIVNLVEKTEAKRKSETTDERKANASFDIPSPTVLGRNASVLGATTWEPSASNKQEFKDNENNTSEIKGAITVTVVEVLANGNLVVAGEKQVAINNDTEYIRLAGVVNPAQISTSNTVNSTQLANAQFESKNAQSLDKSQLGSMMARFFLTILPF
jgi:flagellar L-ring protein precursor FlgH